MAVIKAEKEEVKPRPDIIAIAKKRRHSHLLKKLGKGTLSKSELSELERFEQEHAETTGNADQPPHLVNTNHEAARHFNVAARTIQYWFSDGCPKRPDGKFDLNAIAAWKNARNQKNGTPDPDKIQDLKERIRGRQLKNEILALDLQKQQSKVIDREEVIAERIAQIIVVKYALLGIPNMAPQLTNQSARDIEATLREKVEDIINGFAGDTPESDLDPVPVKKKGRPKKAATKTKRRKKTDGSERLTTRKL